jgi:hypothetical protein
MPGLPRYNIYGSERELGRGEFPLSPAEVGYSAGIDDTLENLRGDEGGERQLEVPKDPHLLSREDFDLGYGRGRSETMRVLAVIALAKGLGAREE